MVNMCIVFFAEIGPLGTLINEFSVHCNSCKKKIIIPTDRTAKKRVNFFKIRKYM